MRRMISIMCISMLFLSSIPLSALADQPVPDATQEAVTAPASSAEETIGVPSDEGVQSDDEVQSRGLFPSLPPPPKIRSLYKSEKDLAKLVFGNTINYDMVKVTNTLGLGGRPWTTNSPPIYTLNVGSAYSSLTSKNSRKYLLIHELTHVWQGQHFVPFMLNSGTHQTLTAINNGGNVAKAYSYTLGKRWGQYNVEQQASIVEKWFRNGRKTTDARYRYIRDNIRKGRVN